MATDENVPYCDRVLQRAGVPRTRAPRHNEFESVSQSVSIRDGETLSHPEDPGAILLSLEATLN